MLARVSWLAGLVSKASFAHNFAIPRHRPPPPVIQFQRSLTASSKLLTEVFYADVVEAIRAKQENEEHAPILLDVRGDEEVAGGMIPTAVHVPIQQIEEAFDMSDSDFQLSYGHRKPKPSDEIIAYCHAGARAALAEQILRSKGYLNSCFYYGWRDWTADER
eukprot:m.8024 g.8024  ORF g.8024 m.8024 type:complete len:162 (+) comp6864_c0_seq1:34-519(+)